MQVRLLNGSELGAYDMLAQESGKVFYSTEWGAIFGSRLRRYGIFDDQGQLIGAFHLVEERRRGIRILRNPEFTPVVGPLMRIRAKHPVAVLEARRKILEAMAEFLVHVRRSVITLSLDHDIVDTLPFVWRGFKVTPSFTYQLDLSPSLDVIYKGLSENRRNNVSKARRDGLMIERAADLSVVANLIEKTFGRTGGRLSVDLLQGILKQYARPDNSYCLIVRNGNVPVACTLVIHDAHRAYYILSGYDESSKHLGAGALAVWENITVAKALGLKVFDFEGSSLPPVEHFVRGFGGRLTSFFTVNRAWLPLELLLKFVKRQLF